MLKPRHFVLIFFIAAGVTFIACDSDDSPEPMTPRTFADVEADFAAIDLTPGINDVVLEMLNGVSYNFRVISPERTSGESRPLVLTLHGATTVEGAEKNTACYVKPGLDTLRAFILSPYGEGGLWFTDFNQDMIGNLIFLAQKYWPLQTDKIAVTGYSLYIRELSIKMFISLSSNNAAYNLTVFIFVNCNSRERFATE